MTPLPTVELFVASGAIHHSFRRVITSTASGGVLWACGVMVAGHHLGAVPPIADDVDAVMVLIVAVSLVPVLVERLLHRRRRGRASDPTSGSRRLDR